MTREEAIKALRDRTNPMMQYEALGMAIEALERKRGEWVVNYDEDCPYDGIWICSACNYIRSIEDISSINYCPNCGADMRGDE